MELPRPISARAERRSRTTSWLVAGAAVAGALLCSSGGDDELALVGAAAGQAAAPSADGASGGNTMMEKVVASAAQGAVAALVAAWLSAFTEPVVNRLLVERKSVGEAIASVKVADCIKFFFTTFPTNMLKFPVFEIINTILSATDLSGSARGVVNGALFCTLMLPVTNYRFRKSMNLPIELGLLWQAYPPTVCRDIVYGWARGFFGGIIARSFADSLGASFSGKCAMFGLTIWVACIISSPFNEWRGFWLQNPAKKLPFGEFFQPARYARSTGVGATIMGIALSIGMLITPLVKDLFAVCQENIVVAVGVAAALMGSLYFLTSKK
eukprot:TRINITY_DN1327_c0_g1_i1.p1 TRINITY_DN1327_c0_g1~~TRINITY_DN1327_c0_g1_i1.p1  ORF type:complete len:326 (+),score=93.29 TRINITY_DN1327_c0_g1_i1:72-1049(+)